jgi:NADPH-dependent glutamate synthase beta subunit-like oxidoreductase
VGTNAGGYVSLIAGGHVEDAYRLARRPNPLASVCGLICAHPCEDACRRNDLDGPLSIRALKRFATERFGVESYKPFERIEAMVERPRPRAEKPGKVAIIGAGPAGLACAHDLALMGHEAVIFDAAEVAGGMLRLGIPDYRLPPEVLQREIDFIEHLGVEFRLGVEIGEEVTFAALQEDYDAVFIGTGCRKGRGLPIGGATHKDVITAVEFLAKVNLGVELPIGDNVLVIGGGNVAFDAARSAARMGNDGSEAEHAPDEQDMAGVPQLHQALDVARTAKGSLKRVVTLMSLEARHELPADAVEIEEAEEEGIRFLHRVSPQEIVIEDDTITAVRTLDVSRVFDEDGRFSPLTVEGTDKDHPFDTVILAIGQVADLSFLGEDHGLEVTPRSTLTVDPETMQTNVEGVYCGGDVAFGPRIAIMAVADGRRAALGIDSQLTGRSSEPPRVVVRKFETYGYDHPFAVGDYEKVERGRIPTREVLDRMSGQQVELGYEEEEARREAARCLRCWVNTVFDSNAVKGSQCIQCGGCVDVCPSACIDLVRLDHIAGSEEAGRWLLPDGSDSPPEEGASLVKTEQACIRCGLCARRCPTACVTMQAYYLEDEMEFVRKAEWTI